MEMKELIVLLGMLPLVVFGQDTTGTGKVLVGITYSPDYCYRTLRSDTSVQFVADVRNTSEIPVFGFTTGLSLVFQTEKRWTFETGIQYSRKGMQSKKADLIWGQPDPSLPTKVSINYRFDYLDIPFKVGYSFAQIGNKLSFFASAGISANIFSRKDRR
jgi:hypothetical protein